MVDNDTGVASLQSKRSIQHLEQISSLRARGISKDIDLPQLVVCGNQSAGKSSVLEGLTNIPFPRADGVCTKFPTEVIIEHSEAQKSVTASILPHSLRSESFKQKLQNFQEDLENFEQLPNVIRAAGALMGVRGYGENAFGPTFVEDVLRIKVIGQTGMHLSIVDLPGLISNPGEDRTTDDVQTVQRMVDSYIENQRTIIVAIVQATNDMANQDITSRSKHFDPTGQRTVGVITQADLINKGTEGRIALLARNQGDTKLHLGFYIVKNPTPNEIAQSITASQRSANEYQFFHSSPWKEQNLDPNRVGIDKLRDALQTLLDQHIEREIPHVRKEIQDMIKKTERQILDLPKESPTSTHLRMFLSDLAMQYHSLASAALSGDYYTTHIEFFATKGKNIGVPRLRALINNLNHKFADHIRHKGQSIKLSDPSIPDSTPNVSGLKEKPRSVRRVRNVKPAEAPDTSLILQGSEGLSTTDNDFFLPIGKAASATPKATPPEPKATPPPAKQEVKEIDYQLDTPDHQQRFVTEAKMKAWVKETYLRTRGKELPGNSNHVLLTELFHYQSRGRQHIAETHLNVVYDNVMAFVQRAVTHLKMEDYVRDEILDGMNTKLHESMEKAEEELQKLCTDEKQHPITYNCSYTDNIQRSRIDHMNRLLEEAMAGARMDISLNSDATTLLASLKEHVNVDMVEQACSEALLSLDGYYEVALNTFIDNVGRQVIERHLLRDLTNVLSPFEVAGYSDEELTRIAGERQSVVSKRKELQEQLEMLQAGLKDLRK